MRQFKRLADKHIDEQVRILAEAYPGMKVVSEDDRGKAKERIRMRRKDKRATYWGTFDDGELVGVMRMHDFTMNVRGIQVSTGGVGSIAVKLTHKKQGVAKDLMQFYLSHYHKKGAPMAALWPFRPDFYRKMGFGYGGKTHQYRIKPEHLPRSRALSNIRFLNEKDIPGLNACYNRAFQRLPGMIKGFENDWQLDLDFHPGLRLVGFEEDGNIRGYLKYTFESNNPRSWLDNNLVVSEMIYESQEALAQLLSFLHTQLDQVNRVVISSPEDDFHYLLHNPLNGSGHLFPSVNHECHISAVGIMYRVLNCRQLFEELGEHKFGDMSLRLKLTLRDSFFRENEGSLIVHVVDGRPIIAEGGAHDVEISMDVAEFSSLVMGAVNFRSLYAYGLAEISDDGLVPVIDHLFFSPDKSLCLMQF